MSNKLLKIDLAIDGQSIELAKRSATATERILANLNGYNTTIALELRKDGSADITIARREDNAVIAQFELSPETYVRRPVKCKLATFHTWETLPELPEKNRLGI